MSVAKEHACGVAKLKLSSALLTQNIVPLVAIYIYIYRLYCVCAWYSHTVVLTKVRVYRYIILELKQI